MLSRLEKRCLVASAALHGLLVIIVVFGAAFITPQNKILPTERLNVVPTRLIDGAFSGGGGNPKAPRTDEQVKGVLNPPPVPNPPPAAEAPKPKPQTPPAAKETPKAPPAKEAAKKPVKLPDKLVGKTQDAEPPKIELKPVKGADLARASAARAEARAREQAAAQAEAAREGAGRVAKALSGLRAGFEQGTAVETWGPGGEAYANYGTFVKAVYDDAWAILGEADENATAWATVTIARDGRVTHSYISRRSGNALLDHSVEVTLEKVKFVAPFPEGAREKSRVFTIKFNLKSKRSFG